MHAPAMSALKLKKERNLSALVRAALRVYLQPNNQVQDFRPLIATLGELRVDLSRVGSNLNQLAHGFNSSGPVAFDRDALAVSHDELRAEFRRLMQQLNELERGLRRATR